MRGEIDREPLCGRQRIFLALRGLFDLRASLLFGAGTALCAYTLFCFVTGAGVFQGGLPEAILFSILLLVFLVGTGAIAVVLSLSGLYELRSALRGWSSNHPAQMSRFARAEAGVRPDALSPVLHAEIVRLAKEGDSLIDAGRYAKAEEVFRCGFERLPPPKDRWPAAWWFLCKRGEAQQLAGDHAGSRDSWREALSRGGLGKPFIHLRFGQALYEIGAQEDAAVELLRALLLGGEKVFAGEAPEYLEFATSQMPPPEGRSSWQGWTGLKKGSPVYDWLMDPAAYTQLKQEHHWPSASGLKCT